MYLANRSLSQRARHLLIPARGHLRWVGGGERHSGKDLGVPHPAQGARPQGPGPPAAGAASAPRHGPTRVLGRSLHRPRLRPLPGSSAAPPASGPRTPRRLWQFLYLLCLAFSHSLPAGGARTPVAPPAVIGVLGGRRSSLGSRRLATHALCRSLHCLSVCLSLSVSLINVYRTITQKS